MVRINRDRVRQFLALDPTQVLLTAALVVTTIAVAADCRPAGG